MKKIALTCSVGNSYTLHPRYINYITAAAKQFQMEVMPIILPSVTDPAILDEFVKSFDGFLFTGGVDINPSLYGEELHEKCGEIQPLRDTHELMLLERIRKSGVPAFGICRGIQVMAVAAGGKLWQDIYAQKLGEGAEHCVRDENDRTHHPVTLSGSLAEVAGTTSVTTNSYHHQAVKSVPANIEICALTPDGLIEAINDTSLPYYRAVQWHPELHSDELSYKIIKPFFDAL